jgi:hypothetical protein
MPHQERRHQRRISVLMIRQLHRRMMVMTLIRLTFRSGTRSFRQLAAFLLLLLLQLRRIAGVLRRLIAEIEAINPSAF